MTSPPASVAPNTDTNSTTKSSSTSPSPTSPYHQSQQQQPNFNGDLRIDDQAAREFSQNIGKVINLAHLVPSLNGMCQKFQLEQASASVCFERMTPSEREKAREQHFIDGLKRGYDFCFATAKTALDEALTRGVINNSNKSTTEEETSSTTSKNDSNTSDSLRADSIKSFTGIEHHHQNPISPNSSSSNTNNNLTDGREQFPTMQSFNSCEDISSNSPVNSNNGNNNKHREAVVNEHVIQCIAELSYYSIEVLQQVFLVSKNPKIQIYMRNYAVGATSETASNINNSDLSDHQSSWSSSCKFTEYIRSAFATSREIELAWFAEGFRTTHMNLLCNALFDCPAAGRAVLDCEGLIMLILFHGKHLDPENPGLNEWSAFAMRSITKEVPEAGERIAEMKKKAQTMSTEKRKEQEQSEEEMRTHMRNKKQEFM